ncbi:MAG: glycosyltransferase family 2 protein [Candidatus Bathyarchaeota archaeon]|nr:glycosyltransferase family 2 protein [Candidatus Bathyarchaeota archaeon]
MLSIILPTLNEEEGIVETLSQINELDLDKEVLVVDGLSTDNTVENAKKMGAKIVIEKRKGKGVAMATGVQSSQGEFIAFLDGDGTYPPKYLPAMQELAKKHDVVVASRLLNTEGATSSLHTFLHYHLFPLLLKKFYYGKFETTEPITGMRVMRKNVWNKLNLKSNNFFIETEMEVEMAKRRMIVAEIPIPCMKRIGQSKWDFSWKTWIQITKYARENETYLKKLNVVRYRNIETSRCVISYKSSKTSAKAVKLQDANLNLTANHHP